MELHHHPDRHTPLIDLINYRPLVAEATGLMTQLLAMLPDARSSEELTGVEGAAARAYFGALGVLMPAGLT
jgi:CRISPR/Cas system-associated endonuclease Cas1